jgi:peptidoglycan hydrolase CwlO-like protein
MDDTLAPLQEEIGMTFEEFVVTPEGAPLHADYEATKKTLSTCKGQQKQIVALLNKLKNSIDGIQNQLQELQGADATVPISDEQPPPQQLADGTASTDVGAAAGAGAGAGADDLKQQLVAAKRDYRLAAKELEQCMAQAKETEALKKRAMAVLLEAFDSSRVVAAPAPHCLFLRTRAA